MTIDLPDREYSPTPVGQGEVDSNTLFFIDELTGPLGKAWCIFLRSRRRPEHLRQHHL